MLKINELRNLDERVTYNLKRGKRIIITGTLVGMLSIVIGKIDQEKPMEFLGYTLLIATSATSFAYYRLRRTHEKVQRYIEEYRRQITGDRR